MYTMTFEKNQWQFLLHASTTDKAKKVLQRITQQIGPLEIEKIQPYWKEPTLFEIFASGETKETEKEKAIFASLQQVNQLSNNVTLIGPELFGTDKYQMEILCDDSNVVGLHSFRLHMDNFLP